MSKKGWKYKFRMINFLFPNQNQMKINFIYLDYLIDHLLNVKQTCCRVLLEVASRTGRRTGSMWWRWRGTSTCSRLYRNTGGRATLSRLSSKLSNRLSSKRSNSSSKCRRRQASAVACLAVWTHPLRRNSAGVAAWRRNLVPRHATPRQHCSYVRKHRARAKWLL